MKLSLTLILSGQTATQKDAQPEPVLHHDARRQSCSEKTSVLGAGCTKLHFRFR